jgi:hypothetical protein
MMLDERRDQTIRVRAAGDHVFERVVAAAVAAVSGFLSGSSAVFAKNPCSRLSMPISAGFLIGD